MQGTEDLEGPASIVSGGAGESQMQCLLGPALFNVGQRLRLLEDSQDVLQEVLQLFHAVDVVDLGGDVFIAPQWAALSRDNELD